MFRLRGTEAVWPGCDLADSLDWVWDGTANPYRSYHQLNILPMARQALGVKSTSAAG